MAGRKRDSIAPPAVPAETVEAALGLIPGAESNKDAVKAMVLACDAGDIFPTGCPPAMKVAVCAYAIVLKLDAALKEVIAFKSSEKVQSQWVDKWSVYVTADGYVSLAGQFSDFRGVDPPVILTEEERKVRLIKEPLALTVRSHREGWAISEGLGKAGDPDTRNYVEKQTPYDMAVARATRKAVKRQYPANTSAIAAQIHRLETNEQLTFEEARGALNAAIEGTPAPKRLPDDLWGDFWSTATQFGIDKAKAYSIIEGQGYDLTYEDPNTGEITKSMRAFDGNPAQAMQIIQSWLRAKGILTTAMKITADSTTAGLRKEMREVEQGGPEIERSGGDVEAAAPETEPAAVEVNASDAEVSAAQAYWNDSVEAHGEPIASIVLGSDFTMRKANIGDKGAALYAKLFNLYQRFEEIGGNPNLLSQQLQVDGFGSLAEASPDVLTAMHENVEKELQKREPEVEAAQS